MNNAAHPTRCRQPLNSARLMRWPGPSPLHTAVGVKACLWRHRTPNLNDVINSYILIVLAIPQCAARASTLTTHKHSFPDTKKSRKDIHTWRKPTCEQSLRNSLLNLLLVLPPWTLYVYSICCPWSFPLITYSHFLALKFVVLISPQGLFFAQIVQGCTFNSRIHS